LLGSRRSPAASRRHATCACAIRTPSAQAGEASGRRTRRAKGRRCWRQDQRADTSGLSAAAREEIASLATTRKLAARSLPTQLPPHPPAIQRRGCRGPKQGPTDAPGMRCRLSPTADVPSHSSGAAKCRLCCKSLKTPGDKFPARRRNKPRSLIDVVSGSLSKSPVSLSPGDEVPPHVYSKAASTARKICDQRCKKTFATQSAISGH
jgi:hypothetical protein